MLAETPNIFSKSSYVVAVSGNTATTATPIGMFFYIMDTGGNVVNYLGTVG